MYRRDIALPATFNELVSASSSEVLSDNVALFDAPKVVSLMGRDGSGRKYTEVIGRERIISQYIIDMNSGVMASTPLGKGAKTLHLFVTVAPKYY